MLTIALVCGLLSLTSSRVAGDYTVTVDATATLIPSWDGFGASLSWWANHNGHRVDVADALYTLNASVTVVATSVELRVSALGFNIARYNIGGSSRNVIDNAGVEHAMK